MQKKLKGKLQSTALKIKRFVLANKADIFLSVLILGFSIYVMFSTFGYEKGGFVLDFKLWSDFVNHIPLMRSFSYGDNFPPELPLYANEPIRYHFVFYMLVGLLEKLGIRLDIALNVLSALGMAGLLFAIYKLTQKIYKSKFPGFISILLFIFNPALNLINYFITGPKKLGNIGEIFTTKTFSAFGPYDDSIIQAFWNWNIWTNQRHLAFSILLMFVAVWLIIYCKKWFGWILGAVIIGLMAWMHKAVLMVLLIILVAHLFVGEINKRNLLKALILGVLLSLFGIYHLNSSGTDIRIQLGYGYLGSSWWEFPGITDPGEKWFVFWLLNMGFLPIYALFGLVTYIIKHPGIKKSRHKLVNLYNRLVNKNTIWFYIALAVFAIGNIFAFSVDINANHKLFNLVIIFFSIYVAGFVYYIYKQYKIVFVFFLLPVVLGGILDMFPVINDTSGRIEDIPNDSKAQWILANTSPKAVFFNLSGDNTSISISGRKVYFGPVYFTWSNGYNLGPRENKIVEFVKNIKNHNFICSFLIEEKLDYVWALNNDSEKFNEEVINISGLKQHMVLASGFPDESFIVFSTEKSCRD